MTQLSTDEKRIVDWCRNKAAIFHGFAAENDHLRKEHIALSSAYGGCAEAIERGDHRVEGGG